VFFGHVCGSPSVWGNTLEEFYDDLTHNNRLKEKPLR
jgi:hypothetical protein